VIVCSRRGWADNTGTQPLAWFLDGEVFATTSGPAGFTGPLNSNRSTARRCSTPATWSVTVPVNGLPAPDGGASGPAATRCALRRAAGATVIGVEVKAGVTVRTEDLAG
jgi:hypothetical protein